LAATIRSVADEAGATVVAVLEGGYSVRGLTLGMAGIAAGLLGDPLPAEATHDSAPPPAGHPGRQQMAVTARLDAVAAFQSQFWGVS
jgi:acetoin utilization deacetylase AcuC-like enzyme